MPAGLLVFTKYHGLRGAFVPTVSSLWPLQHNKRFEELNDFEGLYFFNKRWWWQKGKLFHLLLKHGWGRCCKWKGVGEQCPLQGSVSLPRARTKPHLTSRESCVQGLHLPNRQLMVGFLKMIFPVWKGSWDRVCAGTLGFLGCLDCIWRPKKRRLQMAMCWPEMLAPLPSMGFFEDFLCYWQNRDWRTLCPGCSCSVSVWVCHQTEVLCGCWLSLKTTFFSRCADPPTSLVWDDVPDAGPVSW